MESNSFICPFVYCWFFRLLPLAPRNTPPPRPAVCHLSSGMSWTATVARSRRWSVMMSLAKEVVSINPAPGLDWFLTLTPHPTGTSGSQLGRLLLRHRPSRVVGSYTSWLPGSSRHHRHLFLLLILTFICHWINVYRGVKMCGEILFGHALLSMRSKDSSHFILASFLIIMMVFICSVEEYYCSYCSGKDCS